MAFDAEVAARRGRAGHLRRCGGGARRGRSTLALIHSSDAGATAPTLWAIVFFVAAQLTAVAAALALLQASILTALRALAGGRRAARPPQRLRVGRRRGHDVLRGCGAAGPWVGGRARRRPGARLRRAGRRAAGAVARPPARALGQAGGPPAARGRRTARPPAGPALGARSLLLLTTCLAAAAAFLRDLVEQATVGGAIVTAGIEAMAVIACFLVSAPRSACSAAEAPHRACARSDSVARMSLLAAPPPSATLAANERVQAKLAAGEQILHLAFGEAGLPGAARRGGAAGGGARARTATGRWRAPPRRARRRPATSTRRGLPTEARPDLFAPGSKPLLFALLQALPGRRRAAGARRWVSTPPTRRSRASA